MTTYVCLQGFARHSPEYSGYSSSSLPVVNSQLWGDVHHLKLNIMKSTSYKNSREEQKVKTNLWDAFNDYLETTYFPGASELLDTKTIAFEYESFKKYYA